MSVATRCAAAARVRRDGAMIEMYRTVGGDRWPLESGARRVRMTDVEVDDYLASRTHWVTRRDGVKWWREAAGTCGASGCRGECREAAP